MSIKKDKTETANERSESQERLNEQGEQDFHWEPVGFHSRARADLQERKKFFEVRRLRRAIEESNRNKESEETKKKNGTSAKQQILLIEYLLKAANVQIGDPRARGLVELLTNRTQSSVQTAFTKLKNEQALRSPKARDARVKDLEFIRHHFENLCMKDLAKMVQEDIEKIKVP